MRKYIIRGQFLAVGVLLLAVPVCAADYPSFAYESAYDTVEPMNRKPFSEYVDPECKSWMTLYPPGNMQCSPGLPGSCVIVCTERQRKEVCAKQPELIGCEDSPCQPTHILSLLEQQAEFASEAKLLQMLTGIEVTCGTVDPRDSTHSLPTIAIKPPKIDPDTRARWEQVTEEVRKVLAECKK